MSFYKNIGELVLGSRLKRLSDKFMMDVSRIYTGLEIDFEISWFPLFYLLDSQGEMSVTETAKELEITHSAVSQLISTLQKKQLIEVKNHHQDKRKKIICFTKKGSNLLKEVKPVWESLDRTLKKTLSQGVNSSCLLDGLTELEESLKDESLESKVIADMRLTEDGIPEIIDFDNNYLDKYKALILDWILEIENNDVKRAELLSDPERLLFDKNGNILLAKNHNKIIGSIIAIPKDKHTYEILFFIVTKEWQKRNIGKLLLGELRKRLQGNGCNKIIIKINSNKANVIKLFKENGFLLGSVTNKTNKDGSDNTNICLEQNLGSL